MSQQKITEFGRGTKRGAFINAALQAKKQATGTTSSSVTPSGSGGVRDRMNDVEMASEEGNERGGTIGGVSVDSAGSQNYTAVSAIFKPLHIPNPTFTFRHAELWKMKNDINGIWQDDGATGGQYINSDFHVFQANQLWQYMSDADRQLLSGMRAQVKIVHAKRSIKSVEVFPQAKVGDTVIRYNMSSQYNPKFYVLNDKKAGLVDWQLQTWDHQNYSLADVKTLTKEARYSSQQMPYACFFAWKRDAGATNSNRKFMELKDLVSLDKDALLGLDITPKKWKHLIQTAERQTLDSRYPPSGENWIYGSREYGHGFRPTLLELLEDWTVGPQQTYNVYQLNNVGLPDNLTSLEYNRPTFIRLADIPLIDNGLMEIYVEVRVETELVMEFRIDGVDVNDWGGYADEHVGHTFGGTNAATGIIREAVRTSNRADTTYVPVIPEKPAPTPPQPEPMEPNLAVRLDDELDTILTLTAENTVRPTRQFMVLTDGSFNAFKTLEFGDAGFHAHELFAQNFRLYPDFVIKLCQTFFGLNQAIDFGYTDNDFTQTRRKGIAPIYYDVEDNTEWFKYRERGITYTQPSNNTGLDNHEHAVCWLGQTDTPAHTGGEAASVKTQNYNGWNKYCKIEFRRPNENEAWIAKAKIVVATNFVETFIAEEPEGRFHQHVYEYEVDDIPVTNAPNAKVLQTSFLVGCRLQNPVLCGDYP